MALLDALGRGKLSVLAVGVEGHREALETLAVALDGKELSGVVGVVKGAVRSHRDGRHAVVLVRGAGRVEKLRLLVANAVTIDATGVVVGGEVDVGLSVLDRDDGLGLDVTARIVTVLADIVAVSLAHGVLDLHGRRVDNGDLTVVILGIALPATRKAVHRRAAHDNLSVGEHRR